MNKFKTSGTTGDNKVFYVSDEFLKERSDRFDLTKGSELGEANSLLVCLSKKHITGRHYADWAADRNIPFRFVEGSIDDTVAFILTEKPNVIVGGPGYLTEIAKRLNKRHIFDVVISTSSGIKRDQLRTLKTMGTRVVSDYGTSEVSGISKATSEMLEANPNCVGTPHSDVEIRIENGEIQVKNPVMIASYENPMHTSMKFTSDGWFRTGDRGYLADGMLFLVGRMDPIVRPKI